jgi:membrane-anchored protein YejM (alkaline phosphatase superfamily)
MLQRIRKFALELHEDETGPNTVEWVLLIIIALILLVVILLFAKWVIDKFKEKKEAVETDPFMNE